MKRLVQGALGKLGYQLARVDRESYHSKALTPFFSAIQRAGFAPRHIVDVGANRGLWTRETIKYFPNAQYTLVEPQDHLKEYIRDLIESGYKISWIHAGVGDQSGLFPFHVSYRDDSSTFVVAGQAQKNSSGDVLVNVKTLNQIVAESGAPTPDLVKIDAEGFDLKVLAGASNLLGKTDIFLVEAVVCAPDFENTMGRVLETMANAGYRVIDITELNRSPKHGLLWLCELAFLRNGSTLLDDARSYE